MKRIIIILTFFALPQWAGAQDFIDNVFAKYSGNPGFTSISIGKDLINIALEIGKATDHENANKVDMLKGKISDLKILVSNDHHGEAKVDFMNEIKNNFKKSDYISLMEILDGKDKVNFYVKMDNDKIVHLLLLAVDDDEQVLLSLKGNFTMKDLIDLGRNSSDGSFHHLSYLKSL